MGSALTDYALALLFVTVTTVVGFTPVGPTQRAAASAEQLGMILSAARSQAMSQGGATIYLDSTGYVKVVSGEAPSTTTTSESALSSSLTLAPAGGASFSAGALFIDPDGTVRPSSGTSEGQSVTIRPSACSTTVEIESTDGQNVGSFGCTTSL